MPMESSGTGYVESRVSREEAVRHEPEARAMDGHHWPVLWSRDVGNAHRVPENHIAVDERAVRLDPPRQPIASTSLIHELAGRVLLGRVRLTNNTKTASQRCDGASSMRCRGTLVPRAVPICGPCPLSGENIRLAYREALVTRDSAAR